MEREREGGRERERERKRERESERETCEFADEEALASAAHHHS
jgi:hypothetical protein